MRTLALMDRLQARELEDGDPNPPDLLGKKAAFELRKSGKLHEWPLVNRNHYPELVVKPSGYSWDAEAYDRGEETIVRYGCQGCHEIKEFGPQVGYAKPPRVGRKPTAVRFHAARSTPSFTPSKVRPTCEKPNGPSRRSAMRSRFKVASAGSTGKVSSPSRYSKRPPVTLAPARRSVRCAWRRIVSPCV